MQIGIIGSPEHERAKADYMRWIRDHFGYLGVEAVNWYTIGANGWQHSDLAPIAWEVWR